MYVGLSGSSQREVREARVAKKIFPRLLLRGCTTSPRNSRILPLMLWLRVCSEAVEDKTETRGIYEFHKSIFN
jgi:hypothetical protein